MVAPSPQLFAAVVTGALRLGREGYKSYLTSKVVRQDLLTLVADPAVLAPANSPEEAADDVNDLVKDWILSGSFYEPGKRYAGVFAIGPDGHFARDDRRKPKIEPRRRHLFEQACAEFVFERARVARPEVTAGDIQRNLIIFQHQNWYDKDEASPWARFARHVLDVGLDVLAVQPGLVGVGGNLEGLFTALAPNLAVAFDAEARGEEAGPIARELAETFVEAALTTIADDPGLVTDDKRWSPLIAGVLQPLQEEVAREGRAFQVFADGRLRRLIAGPMAHGALTALSENADAFFKGEFDSDEVLGQVVRETLGVIASIDAEGFHARRFFTEEGAVTVFDAALKVAKEKPELFLRADTPGEEAIAVRRLLAGVADALSAAPRPFGVEDGLAPDIASVALGVLGDYATVRVRKAASAHDPSQMGVDVAAHLIRDLTTGLKAAVQEGDRATLAAVFTRTQAIDVLQIMAEHVAKSPHLVVGERANEQVAHIAQTVGAAIVADTDGLLSGEDWRAIIVVALDTALKNPGKLFSLDPQAAGDSVALAVIREILGAARAQVRDASGPSGQVLFGETLSKVIRATLAAAGGGSLSVLRDQVSRDTRLAALSELIARLDALAASDDPATVIGADDWVAIYVYYVAAVLANGSDALRDVSDEDLLKALREPPVPVSA
ncbi:MAG: hypothetical protein MI723_18365 [Caulobacterales bacterium]|nr:hypothetical protein [Caulobacterales bacterium]